MGNVWVFFWGLIFNVVMMSSSNASKLGGGFNFQAPTKLPVSVVTCLSLVGVWFGFLVYWYYKFISGLIALFVPQF